MNTRATTHAYNDHSSAAHMGRKLICALAACALTVVLFGEVGKSPAQAAVQASAELSQNTAVL